MRLRTQRRSRRGGTLAEAALISGLFMFIILAMLDLGVGVCRFNTISQAARHGARQATVHGTLAPSDWRGGTWGPTAIDAAATDPNIPAVAAVRTMLTGCELNSTRILVEWPEGGMQVEQPVRVTVTTPYRPLLTFFLGNRTITLRASSTMPIAH